MPGIYRDYCCGSNFYEYGLHKFKNAVHVQLGIDDVEVCCGLKSKAGTHKITAIYFKILNVPPQFSSKLNQIFLVAVCEVPNWKASENGIDSILEFIVKDFKELEETGISVNSENIKGFLRMICFDNLGGNTLYGLKESFSSDFFCRFCEMNLDECQKMVSEDESKLRDIASYEKIIELLNSDPETKFEITKGFKDHCLLNEIKYFHILKNKSVDLMHDIMEGIALFFVVGFLKYVTNNFFTKNEICARVRDFNYGMLNKRNKPSHLKLKKSNLNQNASQLYCLVLHLPFIFRDIESEIDINVKKAMASLLQLMQIVFSTELMKSDTDKLKNVITEHHTHYKEAFNAHLKAKHHLVTHYPNTICEMGPLTKTTMRCYEAKHKVLTTMARKSNNYVNVAKSLAERHQKIICRSSGFDDEVLESKIVIFSESTSFSKHKSILSHFAYDLKKIKVLVKYLKINGLIYRTGLFIIEEFKVFEIIEVFKYENDYFLLCLSYDVPKFDYFLHSIEIKSKLFTKENMKIFKISDLKNKETYNKIMSKNTKFIIAETLQVSRLCH